MTTKSILLKAWVKNNETVTAFQGEVNSRFLQITLTDNRGAIDLTGKNVQLYAKKPDGMVIFNNAEIIDYEKGIVNIMLTSQISAVPGIISNCEIRVTDSKGATLTFSGLNIIINKALPDTEVESSSEFTALQKAIAKTASMGDHPTLKNNPHGVTAEQVCAAKAGHSHDFDSINNKPTSLEGYGITDAVSITRTINNKDLSNDIVLTANDINAATIEQGNKADTAIQSSEKGEANGVATLDSNSKLVQLPTPEDINAVPTSRTINSRPLSSDINLTASDISAVPITRTINAKPLTSDITLFASDVGALPNTTSIPSKISDLQNDSGFITGYTETDPTVPSWAKSSSKPSYNFSEITNKPNTLSGYGIINAVPTSRTINGKSLSEDIVLNSADIGLDVATGTISWSSEVSDHSNSYIKRIGNLVILYLHFKVSSSFSSTEKPICTIPAGFRPAVGQVVGASIGQGLWSMKAIAYCYIGAGGAISITDSYSNNCNSANLNLTFFKE